MAAQTQSREGHYFRVLQRETRILGDYEQVHFRRSSVVVKPVNPAHSSTLISIAPRRPVSRPQYVTFNKQTAALYLRQTESLWLNLDLTRQEATEKLFDRPPGFFIVRGSQKAKYALSLRVQKEESEDTVVRHFLIQTNQQKFLTIQGSNLPFISIYDLLAYFCFHRSGGMPCCLKPPTPGKEESKIDEGSESSDSDSEGEQASPLPPVVPPRTASMGSRPSGRGYERPPPPRPSSEPAAGQTETFPPKKKPPPKPPRPTGGWEFDDDDDDDERDILTLQREVQTNRHQQLLPPPPLTGRIPPPIKIKPHPSPPDIMSALNRMGVWTSPRTKPPPMRQRSRSSECVLDRVQEEDRPRTSSSPSNMTATLDQSRANRHKVSTLIEMFEAKSPSASPKRERRFNGKQRTSATMSPNASASRQDRGRERPRLHSDVPIPPPKPVVSVPPVPPRPVSSDIGESGAPIIPPRTPAPLLPPKPPGTLPPSRMMVHRRSLSDSNPIKLEEPQPPVPPRLPRKTRSRNADYEMMPYPRLHSSVPTTPKEVERGCHTSQLDVRVAEAVVAAAESEEEWVKLDRPALELEVSAKGGGSGVSGGGGKGEVKREDSGSLVGDNVMLSEVDNTTKGWQIVSNTLANEQSEGGGAKGAKWRPKPLNWAKKLHFRAGKRKPRKRIRKFILELAANQSTEFGQKIAEFITDMRSRSTEAHQKMLLEIRNFITSMHEYLLKHHQNDLNNCGMEGCDNAGHVVECALQEVVLQPLSHFVYLRIEEYYATNGHLFQVQRSIHQGKLKSTEEMGIRPHLLVPSEKVVADMMTLINRMMKTSCAISKLEYLLEVVRLTYENIKDARQPKKSMNDLGADDFLPIFVWVLVQCGFTRAEIEAEYMWGLAHPSLFNGEGGYYLTTLTSAVNVLKELTNVPQTPPPQQQLPTMNNLQTELKVFFEDEQTGQYSSAYYLPIVPTMTAAEICEIIIERRQISEPENYALFTVVDGKASMLEEDQRPQEIKLKWTLQRSLEQSLGAGTGAKSQLQQSITTPTNQFFAFKLRAPGNS